MEKLEFIDITHISENNLESVVLENNAIALKMRKQILELKKSTLESSNKKGSIRTFDSSKPEEKSVDEDDYAFYYEPIIDIKDTQLSMDDLKNEISNYLPVFENGKMNNAIYRIKIEIIKVIQELEMVANGEDDIEMLNLIKEEIEFNRKKLLCIDAIVSEEQQLSSEVRKKNNKIIFLETSSGNYKVINDLKDIPLDYYDSFKELFSSIIDGTFKNLKAFNTTNRAIHGITEVKNFKTRIVFDRINKDTFIILSCFMKDFDTSKLYLESLTKVIANYRNNKEYYKQIAFDDASIIEHEKVKEEVFRILDSNKVKKLGEING